MSTLGFTSITNPHGLGNPATGDLVNSSIYVPPFDYPQTEVIQGQNNTFDLDLILRIP